MTGSVNGWSGRLVALVFTLLVFGLLGSLGCADDQAQGPLWTDPGTVRLSPTRTHVQIEIHNRSGTARPIGGFTLAGEDWDTLRFVDDALPRTIPRNDSVVLALELSPASFRTQAGAYRSGRASLKFSSNAFNDELPIEFVGSEADRSELGAALVSALALAALALALTLGTGRPSRSAGSGGLRLAVAGAFAALLLVAATIPVGLGLCRGRLAELVGPRELEQCREALGGVELLALPGTPGIWWWLVALALVTTALTIVRAGFAGSSQDAAAASVHGPALGLALAGLRLLGFALILVALVCGLAPASTSATDLVLVQSNFTKLVGLELPRWGIVAQPLGFALGFVMMALGAPLERAPQPGLAAALERLELLVWAALLVTLFLGGPTIPGLSQRPMPLLAHGPQLLLELVAFALKVAALTFLGARLRTHVLSLGTTNTRLLELHARWTIPLALFNLIAVLIWRGV